MTPTDVHTAIDTHLPGSQTASPARRRVKAWWATVAAVVVIGGAAAGIALTTHQTETPPHGSRTPHTGVPTAGPRALAPQTVVKAYITAINAHDWPRVWQLGGKNLGHSYSAMVTGYRQTRRVVLTSLTTTGETVSARTLAYETNGAVQTYALTYTIHNGVITSGVATLLSTHPSPKTATGCPHITYGADGNVGPLFCRDGQPNPPVLAYFQAMHLLVLGLGANATPGQVFQAMCSDVQTNSTYPIETSAYDLAQRIEGWSFGINPAQAVTSGACPG